MVWYCSFHHCLLLQGSEVQIPLRSSLMALFFICINNCLLKKKYIPMGWLTLKKTSIRGSVETLFLLFQMSSEQKSLGNTVTRDGVDKPIRNLSLINSYAHLISVISKNKLNKLIFYYFMLRIASRNTKQQIDKVTKFGEQCQW